MEDLDGMKENKTSPIYRAIRWLVWLFYPKLEVVGAENLPEEASVIVGNHAQMHGPIASELYFPGERYIWCAGQMMHLKDVPDYAFQDFWSRKPKCIRWFYRLLSYVIAPLSVCIFNNAHTIGVYHDTRIVTTFRKSMSRLAEGANVVVFPEKDEPCNDILYQFQDRFIDIARMYYRKTGRELSFVPLYIAPKLKKMYIGKPIRYQADAPMEKERERICGYLMEEITSMAESLPRHKVVPYRNVPKKEYPFNVAKEAAREEAGR